MRRGWKPQRRPQRASEKPTPSQLNAKDPGRLEDLEESHLEDYDVLTKANPIGIVSWS